MICTCRRAAAAEAAARKAELKDEVDEYGDEAETAAAEAKRLQQALKCAPVAFNEMCSSSCDPVHSLWKNIYRPRLAHCSSRADDALLPSDSPVSNTQGICQNLAFWTICSTALVQDSRTVECTQH